MARPIPIVTRRALEQPSSAEALLTFVTISHETLDAPIRLVLDAEPYVAAGARHEASWFELTLLSDGEGPPTARFSFPAIDRQALARLESVVEPARVAFKIIAASAFDLSASPRIEKTTAVPIYTAESLFLTDVTLDAERCEGTVRSWDYRQEAWPNKRATQALAPGAWQ